MSRPSIFFLLACSGLLPFRAGAVEESHAHVSFLLERGVVAPGGKFSGLVRFDIDPGWHIYWKNPGNSGMAPKLAWTLPQGVRAQDPLWPVPKKFGEPPVVNYGYEDGASLLVPLSVDSNAKPSGTLEGKLKIKWL